MRDYYHAGNTINGYFISEQQFSNMDIATLAKIAARLLIPKLQVNVDRWFIYVILEFLIPIGEEVLSLSNKLGLGIT
jgi:hypothetical protein